MALPTVTKTWAFSVNNTRYWNGDLWDKRTLMVQIKNWFKSVGWTVRSSCNSSTAYNDGTDSWISAGNLNYNSNSSARSWLVMRAPAALGANYDVLLDCNSHNGTGWSGNPSIMRICAAQNGYNLNGTTSAAPTAINGYQTLCTYGTGDLNVGGLWGAGRHDWGYTYRWHAMSTSDQKQFRVIICMGGYAQGIWLFERLDTVETPAVWTEPVVACICAIGNINHAEGSSGYTNNDPFIAGSCAYSLRWQGGWTKISLIRGLINTQQVSLALTTEYIVSDPLATQWGCRNEITGKWPIYPLGIAASDTGRRGRQGMMTDLWLGAYGIWNQNTGNPQWGVLDGETYPDDGTRKLVQFGNLIMPWTGSAASPVSTPCYVA